MQLRCFAIGAVAALLISCGGAQARKTGYMTKGREYLAGHNYEKARLEFRNALQLDPTDADAAYLAGRATEYVGNVREAALLYQDAIQSNAQQLDARAALARLYVFAGQPEMALELVEPGLKTAPANPALLISRSAAHARQGDIESAKKDAEAALAAAPTNENAAALLASIYSESGNLPRAIETVRKAVQAPAATADLRAVLAQLYTKAGRRNEAIDEWKRVIALDSRKYIYRYQLAQLYLLEKNTKSAEATLRTAVKDLPRDSDAELTLVSFLETHQSLAAAETELKRIIAVQPKEFGYRLRLGQFYASHGKLPQAEVVDRKIIEDDSNGPSGLAARNHLARELIANQQSARARPLIDEVLKQNARDNDALATRAELSLARGDTDAAITDLRTVQHDQPNSVPIQRALARAYLRNNDTALAEETLRAAVQHNPNDADLQLDLARMLARTDRLDDAVPILTKVVTTQPDNLQAIEALFDVHVARRDFSAARRLAETVQAAKPQAPIGYFMTGTAELRDKHFDAARTAYEHAAAIAPSALEPITALVRLDITQGHADQALARLHKAIERMPRDPVLLNLEGEVLRDIKRADEAIAAWRAAIALAPQWSVPYRNIALVEYRRGAGTAALKALDDGIKATDGAPDILSERAAAYEQLGRPGDAIAEYESLLKSTPDSAAVSNSLAMLLVTYRTDQASLDRARELAERFASSPDPALLDTWGWVLYKRGDAQAACAVLQQAVDKAPEAPLPRYHLAMAQLKAGVRNQARSNLGKAISAGVPFTGIEHARQILETLDSQDVIQ